MPTTPSGNRTAGPTRRRIAGDRGRRTADVSPTVDALEVVETPTAVEAVETPDEVESPDAVEAVETRDEVVEPPDAVESPDAGETGAAHSWHRSRWAAAALSICLVAVLVACALAFIETRADRADRRAGDAALAAARSSAATILSYDYRHLDADFATAAALTTGSFRTDYQATTTKSVAQLATQTKAVVVAKVVAGGVVASNSDRVTVLLFVNQTTTSNRLTAAKTDLNRVQMTMTRSGSRWLVSGLKAL